MELNFLDIVIQQEELDREILLKYNLNYKETFQERKLALLVELGELANEIRSFKYWSTKAPSAKDVILEEYADGLHFISGFCVQYIIEPSFKINVSNIKQLDKNQITVSINKLFKIVANLKYAKPGKTEKIEKIILKIYKKYIFLGLNLGYTINEIKDSYSKKHEINHIRQETNY
ncbi:MAG: dUTP diphosphatase [Mycoplasmataceae bacterium]|nr:dUTP diphosphatase [Mycoplasmataceae bacterium]